MAAIAGALIAGGTSLLGGMMGSSASSKAAKQQLQASREATAEQRRQYDLNRADLMPFLQTGYGANSKLAYLLGINTLDKPVAPLTKDYTTTQPGYWTAEKRSMFGTGSDMQVTPSSYVEGKTLFNDTGYNAAMSEYERNLAAYNQAEQDLANGTGDAGYLLRKFTPGDLTQDPGYQFQMEQGQQAIDRAAAARGNRYAGSTLKELLRFNTGLADSTYNQAFNRDAAEKSRIFGMLTGVTGQGSSTANSLAGLGQAASNNISSNILAGGNAQAAGTVGSANALASGIGNAANFWNQYQWLKGQNNQPQAPLTSSASSGSFFP